MNIASIFRLPKYGYSTVCMPIINSQHLFSVINFATSSSFDFQHQQHGFGTYSKSESFPEESDNFENVQEIVDEKEKFRFQVTRKLSTNKNVKALKIKIPQKDESDVFGNLSEKSPVWYPDMYEPSKIDNDLSDDSIIVKNLSKRFRCPKTYFKEMKRLVNEKKVKEALDLFVDMRKNFVTPLHSHFTYMIGVCGRIGYTEMAFKLLRQMTDRSYQPTPATLTGLFNSCAESPFPEYGLKKARLLKEKIETKNWLLNAITYRAMIKAFGKCGDLYKAFEIVDDMVKAGFEIDIETYSFLLMSCVANKENGFTYAVEVWRKMKAQNCIPNIFTCNLLLRAARDCEVGPEEISGLLLQHWSGYSKRPYGFLTKGNNSETDRVQSSGPTHQLDSVDKKSSVIPSHPEMKSLLSARPTDGPQIIELLNIKTPSDRLNLMGGLEGFLEMMSSMKVKPDIKTFTLLLECLPPDTEEEEKLLSYIDRYKMKPDVDFFNILIKRRNFRKETKAAKNVLVLINKYELTPNIMTFGVLALGCRTLRQAAVFTSEMEKLGSTPNVAIVGCLLRNACVSLDFPYMRYVMRLAEKLQVRMNEKAILDLEKTLSDVRKNILLMEQGKNVDQFYRRENLQGDFKDFSQYYDGWLKRIKFEPEQHPWRQYRTDIIDKGRSWEIERPRSCE